MDDIDMASMLMGRDNKGHDAYIIIDVDDETHVNIYTAGVNNGVVRNIDFDKLIESLESMRRKK